MGATSRKPKKYRSEQVPDYVRTSDSREASMLATSPATLKAHEARRGTPIIVPQTVKQRGLHRLSVKELMELRVDTRYQREEVTGEVNSLIVILKSGGMIPDPISVVERKYGDGGRYIVDGQQRWWAHVDTGTPIYAILYEVHSFDDEKALFHAFNTQVNLSASRRLASYPGVVGETLRRLNEDEGSPLRGTVRFGAAGHNLEATILLRGLVALISNTAQGSSKLDRLTSAFARHYKQAPRIADRMIDRYALLVAELFGGKRLRPVVATALGRICYAAWTADPTNMPMPTPTQINRLKALNWDALIPSHAQKWVPVVIEEIRRVWPVEIVQTSVRRGAK